MQSNETTPLPGQKLPHQAAVDILEVKQLHGYYLVPEGLATCSPDLQIQLFGSAPTKTLMLNQTFTAESQEGLTVALTPRPHSSNSS